MCGFSLLPIGCTPALSVTQSAAAAAVRGLWRYIRVGLYLFLLTATSKVLYGNDDHLITYECVDGRRVAGSNCDWTSSAVWIQSRRRFVNAVQRSHLVDVAARLSCFGRHEFSVLRQPGFNFARFYKKRRPFLLANLVTVNTTDSQRRHLRPSTTRSAAVRRARTQFGKRAFSVCGSEV